MMLHAFIGAMVDPSGTKNPCVAALQWDTNEPAAVKWEFTPAGQDPVDWSHSRELLISALTTSSFVGMGDVGLSCEGDTLWVYLNSPEGDAIVCMPREPVDLLIEDSIRTIPSGSEAETSVITDSVDRLIETVLSVE